MGISLAELTAGMPDPVETPAAQVRAANAHAPVLIVLDDDPTGTQSVADLPVLTSWNVSDLEWGLQTGKPAVYVMTNSRSLSPEDAERVNREVATAAYAAARKLGDIPISFVSRSDSTMRGHFPLEPDVLADCIKAETGREVDGVVIVPAFADAGRITVKGTHYAGSLADGFVPVGETEFAKDATFGYQASYLPAWVEEKTAGRVPASQVLLIDLKTLRTGTAGVADILRQASGRQPIVCDVTCEDDLRLLALALATVEGEGKSFLYRVGPPFVRARIGQETRAPLTAAEIQEARLGTDFATGGLIVVGSHVALTTRQLDNLREAQAPTEYEIDVAKVLDPQTREAHLAQIVEAVAADLAQENVVVRTSRTLVTGADGAASLDISRQVSSAVVAVVQGVLARRRPRFVIAKGGITSSDVASKGLGIRYATVLGPMLPGIVSAWRGENEPARGIPYIVFAGNVGDETSLTQVVEKLSA
ncbi:type III effector Hrp-dependent outer protein [Actinobaculum suis]|uniref:Type III effector Hrp-dependent outer protein n=1 Tax=Actinobaculum suis TaxID=1657 RepID=A0A7Z8YAA2_9ACTO|nr:four-carbon acid sugar kinase family protein [Actinobaculum suis]VDG77219.1 type III effector Hrp-dependent outer protein [Actinobaculum suis]